MTGAAGGAGGLASALAELPVTVTMIFRAIQKVAAEHGFDPGAEDVRLECLGVSVWAARWPKMTASIPLSSARG
ncbi:MAG: EcsC family protein [Paracoccaceae bacterium]